MFLIPNTDYSWHSGISTDKCVQCCWKCDNLKALRHRAATLTLNSNQLMSAASTPHTCRDARVFVEKTISIFPVKTEFKNYKNC